LMLRLWASEQSRLVGCLLLYIYTRVSL
jgi:hypothetical protein